MLIRPIWDWNSHILPSRLMTVSLYVNQINLGLKSDIQFTSSIIWSMLIRSIWDWNVSFLNCPLTLLNMLIRSIWDWNINSPETSAIPLAYINQINLGLKFCWLFLIYQLWIMLIRSIWDWNQPHLPLLPSFLYDVNQPIWD